MESLVQNLKRLCTSGTKKERVIREKEYLFKPKGIETPIRIYSYNIQDHAYKSDILPIMARGLFIRQKDNANWEICVRGYDKFFNINETETTTWKYLKSQTQGPYQVTLKENGCIIYASAVDGQLLVTSKHALGETINGKSPSHAQKGEEWIDIHLSRNNSSKKDLVDYLEKNNLTAVFELADDDFEEHVLEYPPDKRGLYCHGLNENSIQLDSKSFDQVSDFADRFGFFTVKCLKMNDIQDVQDFAEECAKTGCYENYPVEGFVVRCMRFGNDGNQLQHFFKIKFENPYLMFREWREVTRTLLNGGNRTRYRFELTKKYIDWVSIKIRQEPHLFKEFKQSKGIIKVRNMFLSETQGIDAYFGSDIVNICTLLPNEKEMENQIEDKEQGNTVQKVLLIPIATVGAGKTTLARTLTNLFSDLIGHIQNDNINVKKSAPVFEKLIMDEFMQKQIVFADRNNHLFQHRQGLAQAFKQEYPGPKGKIIALDWQIEHSEKKETIKLTLDRISQRGENHQSLTPKRSGDLNRIVGAFVFNRNPLDLSHPSDSGIDKILKLNIADPIEANIRKVCSTLDLPIPSEEQIEEAIAKALTYQEPLKKEIKSQPAKKVKYYGIKIETELIRFLEPIFSESEFAHRWSDILPLMQKQQEKGWHCTIAVRAAEDNPKHKELVKTLDEKWQNQSEIFGSKVKLYPSKLVFDEHIIALKIERTEPIVESANIHMHITICILNPSKNAAYSNNLLKEFHTNSPSPIQCVDIPLGKELDGYIQGFYY